ncbi:UNVERIFIED_CONTAM: hypothetical protein Scaly_2478900 [Sesamum calycinum]|uniref:Uncharacterized protein n=1 Tax=Sesamum calycinum TaxID=2727403 RepID=A0AAW2LRP7_9LAMI
MAHHPRNRKNPLKLDENPADQIIPISATGEEGFWFKIQSGLDEVRQGIQIPLNTYRAVIEVYVSTGTMSSDNGAGTVQAGAIKFENPSSCLERESNFRKLDGDFEIQAKRENEFSEKEVEQNVKETKRVEIKDYNGDVVSTLRVERKYSENKEPAWSDEETSLVTKLEQEVKEVEEDGNSKISLVNRLRSSGWMFALGEDVLSGAATTSQKYQLQGSVCYTRRLLANNGVIQTDTEGFLCQTATS